MAKARASRSRSPSRIAPGRRQHSIILIHGILGQGFVYWNLIKRSLRGDRFHIHELRLPFFGFGDLRKSAAHIGREVDRIVRECRDETEDGRVDLIAHSAGGLAARYYVKFLRGNRRVHSLVTLGTPHHGTFTGALFPLSPVARQTLPGSDFLRKLNAGDETPGHVHYTSIYSLTDGVVVPPTSAHLQGARNVEFRFLSHWGFLWNRNVYRFIREAVDHVPGRYPFHGDVDREERVRR